MRIMAIMKQLLEQLMNSKIPNLGIFYFRDSSSSLSEYFPKKLRTGNDGHERQFGSLCIGSTISQGRSVDPMVCYTEASSYS